MENKMTDNEIIKALECCSSTNCEGCPYDMHECLRELPTVALDLINRQRAEIERLKKDNEYILMQHRFQRRPGGDCWNDVIEKAKSEAIKEFAERLKENCYRNGDGEGIIFDYEIDNIRKEMTETDTDVP